jgi:hypothetical protein
MQKEVGARKVIFLKKEEGMSEKGMVCHRPRIEDVKKVKAFENLTDQEANEKLDFMEEFCRLIYQCYLNDTRKGCLKSIEEQLGVV